MAVFLQQKPFLDGIICYTGKLYLDLLYILKTASSVFFSSELEREQCNGKKY